MKQPNLNKIIGTNLGHNKTAKIDNPIKEEITGIKIDKLWKIVLIVEEEAIWL